jgi:hypothetical protein
MVTPPSCGFCCCGVAGFAAGAGLAGAGEVGSGPAGACAHAVEPQASNPVSSAGPAIAFQILRFILFPLGAAVLFLDA